MSKKFASQGDLSEKQISFTEIGRDLWAFTAEGDPNTGVIIGDDSVMVIDAQATPRLDNVVVEKIRSITGFLLCNVIARNNCSIIILEPTTISDKRIPRFEVPS